MTDTSHTLTIAEAAAHLRIKPASLANQIARHRKNASVRVPPYITLSGRHTVLPRQEFLEWLDMKVAGGNRTVPAKRPRGRPTKADQIAKR
jgi:hypothetical protein